MPTQEKPKRGRRKVAKADVEKLQSGDVAGTTRKKNTTTRTTKGSRATSVKKAGSASDGATEVGEERSKSGDEKDGDGKGGFGEDGRDKDADDKSEDN